MVDKVRRILRSEQVFFHFVNVILKLNRCRIFRLNVDKTIRPRSLPLFMKFVDNSLKPVSKIKNSVDMAV